ncbi:hypothetical protein B0H10DRAFT_2213000 [Mycena sp. CBHHK59/15]|nr:hypothetical protein B0H10DRAFT_2213000 [Mycena sp. CBHHK59/15]
MDPPPPVPPPRSPLRPPPRPVVEPAFSKRQHALHELLSSERAYASDLALVLEVHIPLAQGPMTAEDVKIIFNNIADLATISDSFCDALEDAMGSALDSADATDDRVGELLMQLAPELEAPYKQYITRHPSALAHLTALPSTPELTEYLAKTRDAAASLSHAWDLASLLIKPVQRLLKYSLLLAAIIDATPATHPDRPSLVSARAAMEEVARAVNEGRRRAEVVKEVLSAPKKPPTVLRIKSFRAPADVNSEAARVDRMAAELARIDVFAQQLSRGAQDWARGADVAARALLAWARSFAAAIGLSATVRSEAFDAFLATLTSALLPRSAALLPQLASDLLTPLARLLASAAQPRQLLASMAEHAPLHHHLLTMPLSAKNRPPPALLTASAHYLALRVQLAAELPEYLALLHRGLAALVRRLAALQAAFFADARDAWAGLWDMLRVDGERNGGGAETEAVWRARWGDVDQVVKTLNVCQPLPLSLSLAAPQSPNNLTPAEAFARAHAYGLAEGPAQQQQSGSYIVESPTSLPYGQPPSPHYERKSGSSASVHSGGTSGSSAKAIQVANVLASLEPRRPQNSGTNVAVTAVMLGALDPHHKQRPPPPPPHVSGPYPLSPGRPRGGSDAVSANGSGSGGWNGSSASGWNVNGRSKPKSVRNKSPAPSAAQTTKTAHTVKEGKAEFGEYKVKDPAREEEKAREKERERARRAEVQRQKEAEKVKKREDKEKKKKSGSSSNSADPSPRSSLASSRIALLESAGYGTVKTKPKSTKPQAEDEGRGRFGVVRRASDITNSTTNSNPNASHEPPRPSSRGRSASIDPPQPTYAYPRAAPHPPSAFPRSRSPSRRPPSPSQLDTNAGDDFTSRRSTWLAAPAQYTCRAVHPCTPPAAVSYFGFPFFALEEHALLGVLHEAGHPSTHPRLPLYVDDGEDCLLLCRDTAGEIGWALASFLAPLAAD